MGLFISLEGRLDGLSQAPAGIGVGHPERGELTRGRDLFQCLQPGPTVQGISGNRMGVNDEPAEHGVQRGFNGRPPAAADETP